MKYCFLLTYLFLFRLANSIHSETLHMLPVFRKPVLENLCTPPKVKLFNLARPLTGLSRRTRLLQPTRSAGFSTSTARMGLHHLMIGTWTPPGAIFTVQFDDEKLELKLIKRTEIPKDEPISWMTFDVSFFMQLFCNSIQEDLN